LASSPVHAAALAEAENPADAQRPGDFQMGVALDASEQSGSANATIRIHASRETLWGLITSCAEALHLVPGLERCEVLETAPDHSSQTIRQVLNYSWYFPKLTYELHATYDKPARVTVERFAGDLQALRVSWTLQADGDHTLAEYKIDLVPGFWVPRWLVRVALRHDLPKMLRALRARAEAIEHP
jgi:hypothetical protein